jgi:hypothetical protein
MFVNSILRIEKVLNKESCHGVRVAMCCSLNCCQHFPQVMLQETDVCEIVWYKIMGISRSSYMSYKQETKEGARFYNIEIRGVKSSKLE